MFLDRTTKCGRCRFNLDDGAIDVADALGASDTGGTANLIDRCVGLNERVSVLADGICSVLVRVRKIGQNVLPSEISIVRSPPVVSFLHLSGEESRK